MQPELFMAALVTSRGSPRVVLLPGVKIRDGALLADGTYRSGDFVARDLVELCRLLRDSGDDHTHLQIWDSAGGRRLPAYFMSISDTAAVVLEPEPAGGLSGGDMQPETQETLPL